MLESGRRWTWKKIDPNESSPEKLLQLDILKNSFVVCISQVLLYTHNVCIYIILTYINYICVYIYTLRRKSKINSTCGPCGPAIHGHFSRTNIHDVPILGKDDPNSWCVVRREWMGIGWNGIGIMIPNDYYSTTSDI